VITTLATPYLIRGSDAVATGFERLAPRWLTDTLLIYTHWVGRIGRRNPDMVTRMIRKWSLQMLLNAALIAVVFVVVSFFAARSPAAGVLGIPGSWVNSAYWLLAVFVSLPLFIATTRKLGALGMLLAEAKVTQKSAGVRAPMIRAIVAQVVPIGGSAILGLYVVVLSSTLLTSWKALVILLGLAGLLSWVLRRTFIRVYSKAQNALTDTLSQPPAPRETETQPLLPPLLRHANLRTLQLTAASPASGRLIRELRLRTLCGASIVGIDRNGDSVINPGPDEELHAGDQVLLLGSADQLASAERLLTASPH
jgi:CPA2 family monovalent cation:H+ antiporter-2